jgi:hypothetical protein
MGFAIVGFVLGFCSGVAAVLVLLLMGGFLHYDSDPEELESSASGKRDE